MSEVLRLLNNPDQSVVAAYLIGLPKADCPAYFAGLLTELEALPTRENRKHGSPWMKLTINCPRVGAQYPRPCHQQ